MIKIAIAVCLAALAAAEADADAFYGPYGYGYYMFYYWPRNSGYNMNYMNNKNNWNMNNNWNMWNRYGMQQRYNSYSYGKRSADAEPKADAWYGPYGYSMNNMNYMNRPYNFYGYHYHF